MLDILTITGKRKEKKRKKLTESKFAILLVGVQDGPSTVLKKVLHNKVLVPLDGELGHPNHRLQGNPELVVLLLSQQINHGFDVLFLQLHHNFFVIMEHLPDKQCCYFRKSMIVVSQFVCLFV